MRLLLDRGVSPVGAAYLRANGQDAFRVRERGMQKAKDPSVLQTAQREDRIPVTFDLDFSRLLALQRLAKPSVILFRLEQFTTAEVNATLDGLLATRADVLSKGAIIVVDPDRVQSVRCRSGNTTSPHARPPRHRPLLRHRGHAPRP